MEGLALVLDDESVFNKLLKESLPDDGKPSFIIKENATNEGNPVMMVTFMVQLPDGSMKRAQTVISLKLVLSASIILQQRYGHILG